MPAKRKSQVAPRILKVVLRIPRCLDAASRIKTFSETRSGRAIPETTVRRHPTYVLKNSSIGGVGLVTGLWALGVRL